MDWAFGKFGMGTFSAGAVWVGYAVSQQLIVDNMIIQLEYVRPYIYLQLLEAIIY